MTNQPPPLPGIVLSREELLLTLTLLKARSLLGLEPDPLGELTSEQSVIALLHAERSLRAREFARLDDDGRLVLHEAIVMSVAVCAFPQQSFVVHHFPAAGRPVRLTAHLRDEAIVMQTSPESELYLFSILDEPATLFQEIISFCECEDLPLTAAEPIKINGDVLTQISNTGIITNVDSAVSVLTTQGVDQASALKLTQAICHPHSVSVLHHLEPHLTSEPHLEKLTVLHNDGSAWLMQDVNNGGPRQYLLQPITTADLRAALRTWLTEAKREPDLGTTKNS